MKILLITLFMGMSFCLLADDDLNITLQPAICVIDNKWLFSDNILIEIPMSKFPRDSNTNNREIMMSYNFNKTQIELYESWDLEFVTLFEITQQDKGVIVFKNKEGFIWADYLIRDEERKYKVSEEIIRADSLIYVLKMSRVADNKKLTQFVKREYEGASFILPELKSYEFNCTESSSRTQDANCFIRYLRDKLCQTENSKITAKIIDLNEESVLICYNLKSEDVSYSDCLVLLRENNLIQEHKPLACYKKILKREMANVSN